MHVIAIFPSLVWTPSESGADVHVFYNFTASPADNVQISPQIFPILGGITESSCRESDGTFPVDAPGRVGFTLVWLPLSLSLFFCLSMRRNGSRLFACTMDTDSFALFRVASILRGKMAKCKIHRRKQPWTTRATLRSSWMLCSAPAMRDVFRIIRCREQSRNCWPTREFANLARPHGFPRARAI